MELVIIWTISVLHQ